jgi:DNA-binding response OmpR family regulator
MNATPLQVLIVDDHVDNARMLKILLQKAGQEARIALDGPAALAAASFQKPDVVLLDLSLPGLSGFDVAAELRRDPEHSGCVVVGISGRGAECVPTPSPFDRYFTKPLDFASLLAYIAEIQARRNPPSRAQAVA